MEAISQHGSASDARAARRELEGEARVAFLPTAEFLAITAAHGPLLRELAEPTCIACRRLAWSEERFVFGFMHEGYADHHVLDALRASLGFCPVQYTGATPEVAGTYHSDGRVRGHTRRHAHAMGLPIRGGLRALSSM